MRFGVTVMATDRSIGVAELAAAAEERGFDSLYLPEHTHIPTSRLTPPPTGDPELAEEYRRLVDPFVALAGAASVTGRIRLGTGVSLVAQREPIATAKALATLQNQSGGRVVLGVGFGWNRDEMAHHGIDYATRRHRAREHVLAMQALWSRDEAEYHGEFVDFGPSWSWPKPTAPIPILIGGAAGPKLFSHVCEYASGWIPIGGSGLTAALPELRARWIDAGNDLSALEVIPFGTLPTAPKLDHFRSLGITECVFRLPSAERDEVLTVLDRHAALIWS